MLCTRVSDCWTGQEGESEERTEDLAREGPRTGRRRERNLGTGSAWMGRGSSAMLRGRYDDVIIMITAVFPIWAVFMKINYCNVHDCGVLCTYAKWD